MQQGSPFDTFRKRGKLNHEQEKKVLKLQHNRRKTPTNNLEHNANFWRVRRRADSK